MKILMVAYYFPPDASSGAFRPLQFARYLKEQGELVTILTAKEGDFLPEQPRDEDLVPESLEIIRTRVFRPREGLIALRDRVCRNQTNSVPASRPGYRAPLTSGRSGSGRFQRLKDFVTTALASPDVQCGWFLPGLAAGKKALDEGRFDLIFATGGPWTGLAIAAALKRMSGLPLILDFRDPWVSNPNFTGRPALIRKVESRMETGILKKADLVVANTAELEQDFLARHPFLAGKTQTLTNGFERRYPPAKGTGRRFTLTHAGSLYLSRNPVHLVRAVQMLAEKKKISREDFRINFVGGINIHDPELERMMASPELDGIIRIIPRVSFDKACQYQQESDLLFLIQPDFPLQVPRKLYENMAFGKPVLAITDDQGATARVVRETGVGQVVENHVPDIALALESFLDQWRAGGLTQPDPEGCRAYENLSICRNMHGMLTRYGRPEK